MSPDDTEANPANPGAANQNDPKPEPPGEGDLDRAIAEAAKDHRWDVVVLLGRELEARRLAGSNVTRLPSREAR